ncbi:UPF0716 protein FxsA [Thalassovita litoralis]|jgi:UPF0716 protein FxsA|uniref:UPF0716 protein FxsA n=1 Tax=Thalassovita litoralis TaxID=1010611 RepID=A0A521AY50_9RHOB|nr:FxsA family protein [Thalassovita litoralis]SMO39719.1 UPF0716 protein FxsA [Thalassovita litoralis]
MWLLIAFVAVPIIEIALFIQVGGLIGMWPTLAIVVLTAILGTSLMRAQGRMAMANLQRSFSELDDPTEPLAHGAMILISGVLLLTPGFFTDAMGFALLVPGIRTAVFRYLRQRIRVQSFTMGNTQMHSRPTDPNTIDGEFYEIDPENRATHRPSGWTKH